MFRRGSLLIGLLFAMFTAVLGLSGCGGSSPAITVSIASTGGLTVVDGTDTLTLTATVANDTSGVTWSVSGGGTLSGETATTAVYTAPAIPTSALTVTVTATSVADATKTGTFRITVPVQLAVSPTWTGGPGGTLAGQVGTAYSVQLTTTTGTPPYTWTVDAASPFPLPACLSMTSGGLITSTGPLTASCAVDPNILFDVTDSGSPNPMTAHETLDLAINPAPAITFGAPPTAAATVGTAYASAVTATGGAGALHYTVSAGSLPTGSNWGMSAAGVITGTPTAGEVAGSPWTFTAEAQDAYGDTATQQYSITVSYPVLTVTPQANLTAYNGTAYTTTTPLATLAASGGSGTYTGWGLTAQGGSSVPPGLSINSSGQIIGTPTANGPYNVTATVTDSSTATASANFTITVDAGITITPSPGALATGYTGSSYTSGNITASGGSGSGYTWTVSSGALPAGVNFSTTTGATTTLTGTPTTVASPASFTLKVTDSANNTQTAAYTITVDVGVSVSGPTTLTYYPGATPSTTFTASGGTGGPYTYTWAAAPSSTLPNGLTLATGGAIQGTPANSTDTAVTSNVIVTATDSSGNHTGTADVAITIQGTVTITTTSPLPGGGAGQPYSAPLAASGGNGSYTWTTDTTGTNNLAAIGLALSSGGLVSNTTTTTVGTETFAATATDGNGHASTPVTFSVTISTFAITTSALSPTYAYGGGSYTGSITAVGGVSPYTWSIASGSATSASQLASYGLSLGSSTTLSNSISGTVTSSAVTTTTVLSIEVQIKDSTNATATQTYSLTLYPQLQLTANLPNVAEGATLTAGQETVTATGGSGSYSFTTLSGLPSGLSFSTSGNVVSIVGTAPSTPGTNNFTVEVQDTTTGATFGSSNDESITVNGPGVTVGGSIALTNYCGNSSIPNVPDATVVNLYTSPGNSLVASTTTSSGNFSFTNVAAGSYTITPSYTGTGIQSAFYPASMPITVSTNDLTNENFGAALGYTVSGTVNYSGGVAGQIYLNLVSNYCGENGAVAGTSLATTGTTSGGTFTINGVPPGNNYTLETWEDPSTLGQGVQNATDPVATSQSVTVNLAPLTDSTAVNLSNPAYTTPSANPEFQVTQIPNGVLLFYQASTNGSKIEDANGYVLNWSTSSTLGGGTDGNQFLNLAGTHTFIPTGPKSATVWFLSNAILTGSNKFTVGDSYYFQVRSYNTLATQTHISGAWWTNGTATQILSTATPCPGTGMCTSVTSSITIPSGVTINAGVPLYEGFYQNSSTGGAPTIAVSTGVASPVAGNTYTYTVSVPSGSGWVPIGILDQNLDGQIDAGDVDDANSNSNGYTVSGGTATVPGVTLPSTGATVSVGTDYTSSTYSGGSFTGYSLYIQANVANQLPVAVELESGPNIMYPIDMSNYCQDCGNVRWSISDSLNGVTPTVGDTYTFKVWYLGNSTPSTITGQVTGWNGGSTLVGPSDLATLNSPYETSTTTPNFSWSVPSADSSDVFQFYLNDNNISGNNTIWEVPSSNSSLNGLPSSTTSLTWDVDPTDGTNKSTESTLNASHTYNWSIEATDSNNNQVTTSTWFQP